MRICNTAATIAERSKNPSSVFTSEEANRERVERARKAARDCIIVAVVASPQISAELIDAAVAYSRAAVAVPLK